MNTKHTPGPWKWIGNPSGAVEIFASDGSNVRLINQVANARLIAAAPELLAALESAMGMLKGHRETPEREARYEFARAAIAKAKGVYQ